MSEDPIQNLSRSSSVTSSSRSASKIAQLPDIDHLQEQSNNDAIDDQSSSRKEALAKKATRRLSFEKIPYNHDILVIQNQPPKVNCCRIFSLDVFENIFYSLSLCLIYSIQ